MATVVTCNCDLDYGGSHDGDCPLRETSALCASELACEIADAWAASERSMDLNVVRHITKRLHDALDRLEAVTRASALRKVRP